MGYKTPKSTSQIADIGSRLRRLRKQQGLTQADLARQIGIQQSDLSRMESGEYRVSLDNLVKLLAVFDLKLADFFGAAARQQPAPVVQRLTHEDMHTLHLLRQLSPEARREVQEFIDFKVRREQVERRSRNARLDSEVGS